MTHRAPDQDEALEWCLRLSDRPLDASEQDELLAWLAADPARPATLDAAIALWDSIGEEAGTSEMLALREQALAAAERPRSPRPVRWYLAWATLAAALLAVLGLAILLHHPGLRYETGIGERRVVALADGSTLILDADSAIDVAYSRDRRTLTLAHGRASFKVAKDPLRPFAVRSGASMVVATGTTFSVERLAGELRVALFEGHVAVLRDTGKGHEVQLAHVGRGEAAAEQALTPGRELVLLNGQAIGSLRKGPSSDDPGTGQLVFTAETLAVAAERVNRYGRTEQIVVDPRAASVQISGVFHAGDVDAFARGVEAAFPVRATRTGTVVRLGPA